MAPTQASHYPRAECISQAEIMLKPAYKPVTAGNAVTRSAWGLYLPFCTFFQFLTKFTFGIEEA